MRDDEPTGRGFKPMKGGGGGGGLTQGEIFNYRGT